MAENTLTSGAQYPAGRRSGFKREALSNRLATPMGYTLVILMAVSLGVLIGLGGLIAGAVTMGVVVGIPFLILFAVNLKVGSVALVSFAFVMTVIQRAFIPGVPVGVVLDAIAAAMAFGLIIHQANRPNLRPFYNGVGIMIAVWILYNLLQFFNPNAASQMAWLYTVRSFAFITIFYYILAYSMDKVSFVYIMIGTWLILAFIGSIYAYIQEYVGLRAFEFVYLASDPELLPRYLQWGQLRKWSIFSDPVVFGFLMSISGVLCLVLAAGPYPVAVRIVLALAAIPFFHSMLFSGLRAAYILPPVALAFYLMSRLSLRTVVASVILGGILLFLINVETGNNALVRFQSAFYPEQDASFEVRQQNLEMIKPYIRENPLGGGLGSTGVWGQRFSPGSFLASFPPDSTYVRIAVEMGWLGLLLYSVFLLVVLKVGIRHYYMLRDPVLRNLQIAMLTVIIMFVVGNFPQEMGGPPNNLLFLFAVAVAANLYRLESNYGGTGKYLHPLDEDIDNVPPVSVPPKDVIESSPQLDESLDELETDAETSDQKPEPEPVPTSAVEPTPKDKPLGWIRLG